MLIDRQFVNAGWAVQDKKDLNLSAAQGRAGLASQPGVIGTIYRKAQNRIQDPAKLKRLIVDLIGRGPGARSAPTSRTMRGYALVNGTARLAAINVLLPGVGTADGDSRADFGAARALIQALPKERSVRRLRAPL